MHVVVMPKLGLTMQQAEVVRWLVELGGEVRAGEPLCEVETDKITMEVESPADGVLLRRVEGGAVVAVGVGMAVVGGADEDASGAALHGDAPAPAGEHQPSTVEGGERSRAPGVPAALPTGDDASSGRRPVAPVARRLAAELGVDLATVTGTGPGGRIVRRDVESAAGISPTDGDAD